MNIWQKILEALKKSKITVINQMAVSFLLLKTKGNKSVVGELITENYSEPITTQENSNDDPPYFNQSKIEYIQSQNQMMITSLFKEEDEDFLNSIKNGADPSYENGLAVKILIEQNKIEQAKILMPTCVTIAKFFAIDYLASPYYQQTEEVLNSINYDFHNLNDIYTEIVKKDKPDNFKYFIFKSEYDFDQEILLKLVYKFGASKCWEVFREKNGKKEYENDIFSKNMNWMLKEFPEPSRMNFFYHILEQDTDFGTQFLDFKQDLFKNPGLKISRGAMFWKDTILNFFEKSESIIENRIIKKHAFIKTSNRNNVKTL